VSSGCTQHELTLTTPHELTLTKPHELTLTTPHELTLTKQHELTLTTPLVSDAAARAAREVRARTQGCAAVTPSQTLRLL
jgi:hypothetical protein